MNRIMITTLALAAMMLTAGGCSPTATTGKDAVKAKWEKATSHARLPVAQQQYAQGSYADALKTVNQCLDADPNFAQARVLSGKIMIALGQKQKGKEEVERALKINSKLDEGYFVLGLCAEESKENSKAFELYTKAAELDGANISYVLAQARVLCCCDEYGKAELLLIEKTESIGTSVDLKFALAQLFERQGKFDQAISMYRQARSLDNNNTDIAESMAYCYVLMNKWSEAAEILDELLVNGTEEQKKNLSELAAMCYMNCGKYGKAVQAYSKLAVSDRANAQAWLRMGQAALGVGDAQRAYACSQKAIDLQAGYTDAILLAGCSQYAMSRYDQAAQSFEKALIDEKSRAFSWMMIGKCFQRKGDMVKARSAFEKAKEFAGPEMVDYMAKIDQSMK